MVEVKKPTIGKRTTLGQAYDLFLKDTKLPIHQWCKERELKRRKVKI